MLLAVCVGGVIGRSARPLFGLTHPWPYSLSLRAGNAECDHIEKYASLPAAAAATAAFVVEGL